MIWLVRHAAAGSRAGFVGDDGLRPLSAKGRRQAEGLVSLLGGEPIGRILSSPATRCWQTVEPLAAHLGLEVEEEPALWEGAAVRPVLDLLDEVDDAVLCSHGDLIPDLLNHLIGDGLEAVGRDCKKGSTWVLERDGDRFTRGTYLPPPA